MKKILWLLFVTMMTIVAYTFGDDLAYVSVDYCDTPENTLHLHVDPLTETGICYAISNNSKHTLTVKVWFVDGTFTNDQWQNKACLSDTDVENFWKYVTDYDQLITLDPGETIKKQATLIYPKDMDGIYYGCLVYAVVADTTEKSSQQPRGNFTILMRKAKFIDVLVGDPANVKEKGIVLEEFTPEEGNNLSRNPKIRVYKDVSDDKYVMQIKIKNISRVQQDVEIQWVTNNIIGQKHSFNEMRKILRGETLLITKKFDYLPLYNLKIKLNIINTPMTFGDVKPMSGLLKEKTCIMIWNATTFITLWAIIVLALIIFLLIKDIKKRRNVIVKVIHDKVPTKKKTLIKKPRVKKTTKKK